MVERGQRKGAKRARNKFVSHEVEFILYGEHGKKFGPFKIDKIITYMEQGKVDFDTRASIVGEKEMITVGDIVRQYKVSA